jgi:hypothetical protein
MTDEKILAQVVGAVFMALGQATGPKTLVNASVLLAQLAHSKALDPKSREILRKILDAVDGTS